MIILTDQKLRNKKNPWIISMVEKERVGKRKRGWKPWLIFANIKDESRDCNSGSCSNTILRKTLTEKKE
jgi:hypothetical protein